MSRAVLILVILLALAAGFGAGYVLRDSMGDDQPRDRTVTVQHKADPKGPLF